MHQFADELSNGRHRALTFTDGARPRNTNSATITANTTFTVTASNADRVRPQASRSVPSAQSSAVCRVPGFAKTLVVNWDWGRRLSKVDTCQTQGGLGTNGILVVPFTPTGPADNTSLVPISATNYPAATWSTPRDWRFRPNPAISTRPAAGAVSAATPSVYYAVGTAPVSPINGKPMGRIPHAGRAVLHQYCGANRRNQRQSRAGRQSCVPAGARSIRIASFVFRYKSRPDTDRSFGLHACPGFGRGSFVLGARHVCAPLTSSSPMRNAAG